MDEWAVLEWFGRTNYAVMQWTNAWWWQIWAGIFFIGSYLSMSPLGIDKDNTFSQIIAIWIRRLLLITSFFLLCLPVIMLYVYDMTSKNDPGHAVDDFITWFKTLAINNWWFLVPAFFLGLCLRFLYNRYFLTYLSGVFRKFRKNQTNDKPSDILEESNRLKPKDFVPSRFYSKQGVVLGLNEDNQPITVPWHIWKENMMQIIGPTGYGKGIILGCVADQIIANGHTVFSINPKEDRFLPQIMYTAAKKQGRKFYYVSLHDQELGSWGPFMGGSEKDGFTRLTMAFNLELTGEPKTDFYKRQETRTLKNIFKRTRRIDSLFNEVLGKDASTAEAELEIWQDYASLRPAPKKGFSIAKAIEENAVVYVKGSLDDRVIKTATKIFIAELIQESRRLWSEGKKKNHLDIMIDETSFVVSNIVKEALATIRSYGVSILNAYQSPDDLLNTGDDSLDGKALAHSMNINSQIKAIYGGADYELAEWASLMSGTTVKEVTKMEKTEVKTGGAETWEAARTIGTVEESLIHPNVLLSLPPRVCILKQPYQLATPLFTSFVPVKNEGEFYEFVNTKVRNIQSTRELATQTKDKTKSTTKNFKKKSKKIAGSKG